MKYADFKQKLGAAIFSRQDIRLRGLKVFGYQLSQWQRQGYIKKIKNGLYLFAENEGSVLPEALAGKIYSPSYISLEKALAFYGLIPEMVYGLTSVTPKTTRRFKNKFGAFIYRHIKPSLFFGYKEIKNDATAYLIAEPEKALLDYLYLNWIKDPAAWDELRLNNKVLSSLIRPQIMRKYLTAFNKKWLTKICLAKLRIK